MKEEEINNIKSSIDKWRTIRKELEAKIDQEWVRCYWKSGTCGYCEQYLECDNCPLFGVVGPMVICFSTPTIQKSHAYSALVKADKKDYVGALKSCDVVLDFMRANLEGNSVDKPPAEQKHVNHYGVHVYKDIPISGVIQANHVQWLIDEMIEDGINIDYENFIKEMEERGFTEEKIERESEFFEGGTHLLGFIKNEEGLYEYDTSADISAIWNEQYVQVVKSKTIKGCALCSPCFPGQGDMDTPGDYLTYVLPEEYYDYEEGKV